jgi:acyl-CoA synthetase (AMP-forming)/AMP-acid ligase II
LEGDALDTWLYIGDILRVNATKFPDKMAVKDADRSLTFGQYNERSCRLGNGLTKMGLSKGDRITIISQNRVEWMEIYAATAKTGIIAVPINWRLVGPEISYIVNDSDAKAFIVHEAFVPEVDRIRGNLPGVKSFIFIGAKDRMPEGWVHYEDVIDDAGAEEPGTPIDGEDIWIQLYTSGTTGKPKGVLRSHRSYVAFFFINEVDFGFDQNDIGMIVMPLCHVNSTFYSFVFTYIGASVYIFPEFNFKAEEMLEVIDRERITYTSLVPTHYALILAVPDEVKARFDGGSIKHLLCSSAPVRKQMKLDIMEFFPNAKLFEAYGSTEAGLVTLLRPEEQLTNLGSIGKECSGTDVLKILDENKRPVPVGEVGELYSKGPMMFTEYYKLPEKTKEAFTEDGYFSAGDMARMDEKGYYHIVDRKANMIITGGENVYPIEVEEVVGGHDAVFDCAVIGLPHEKWGEQVTAVVVLKDGIEASPEEIMEFCKGKIAGYKRPREVIIIKADDMPRTTSGKITHWVLRERYCKRKKK